MKNKILLKIQNINKNAFSKQVVDQIIYLLTSEQLKPGDRLPTEMELIEMLNVSRPVLREGLASLEALGVITRKNRKGTFFNNKVESTPFTIMLSLSQKSLTDLIDARMIMELGLVTIAAEKITDEQLKVLKNTIESIEENTDNNYGHLDKKFHQTIAESADNPIVEGFMTSLLISHNKIDKEFKVREKELTIEQHYNIYTS